MAIASQGLYDTSRICFEPTGQQPSLRSCTMNHAQRKIGPPLAHILETEIDEEVSLYDTQTEQVVVLNKTASDVWRLSDGESDVE